MADIDALQAHKLEYEISKLKIEAALLRRPWCFQSSYIGVILPILAVVATRCITYSNSDFRREAQIAKREIATLGPEAATLRQQVSLLQKEAASLKPERDR